jgi:hypothetical protein
MFMYIGIIQPSHSSPRYLLKRNGDVSPHQDLHMDVQNDIIRNQPSLEMTTVYNK